MNLFACVHFPVTFTLVSSDQAHIVCRRGTYILLEKAKWVNSSMLWFWYPITSNLLWLWVIRLSLRLFVPWILVLCDKQRLWHFLLPWYVKPVPTSTSIYLCSLGIGGSLSERSPSLLDFVSGPSRWDYRCLDNRFVPTHDNSRCLLLFHFV